ncbi:hypothetical protein T484DRAFT_1950594 [Baffinella frigidus]|nr:hypothetical protein T484DRAFT_1950594 [Cryptophyta sp. CCMP2293]
MVCRSRTEGRRVCARGGGSCGCYSMVSKRRGWNSRKSKRQMATQSSSPSRDCPTAITASRSSSCPPPAEMRWGVTCSPRDGATGGRRTQRSP